MYVLRPLALPSRPTASLTMLPLLLLRLLVLQLLVEGLSRFFGSTERFPQANGAVPYLDAV